MTAYGGEADKDLVTFTETKISPNPGLEMKLHSVEELFPNPPKPGWLSATVLGVPLAESALDGMRIMDSVKITSLNIKNHTGYSDVEMNISDTANATTLCIVARVPKGQEKTMKSLQQFLISRALTSLQLLLDEY